MAEKPSAAELDVMAVLWECGEVTARDIRERLEARRPMTHASVATLLKRLEAKGLVQRRKGEVGKAFLYRSSPRSRSTHGALIGDLLERAFRDDPVALVTSLFETRPPTAEQAAELRDLLARLEAEEES